MQIICALGLWRVREYPRSLNHGKAVGQVSSTKCHLLQASSKRSPLFRKIDIQVWRLEPFSDISCSYRWESRGFEPLVPQGTVGPSAVRPCMRTHLLLSNVPAVNMMEAGLLPIFDYLAGFIQQNAIRIAGESGIFKQQNLHGIIAV